MRAAGSRVGLAWAPGRFNASTEDVVSVAPQLYANGTLATSAEGAVRLEVHATNGRVALGEDRVRFREPPIKFRLDVESGPAAQMEGVAEVWTVSTRADHVFGRQRIKIEAAASGDARRALEVGRPLFSHGQQRSDARIIMTLSSRRGGGFLLKPGDGGIARNQLRLQRCVVHVEQLRALLRAEP